jgi:hypothetical protein
VTFVNGQQFNSFYKTLSVSMLLFSVMVQMPTGAVSLEEVAGQWYTHCGIGVWLALGAGNKG